MRYLSTLIIFAAFNLLFAPESYALGPTDKICANATRHTEEERQLPKHLLFAMSLKETGLWNSERNESYTWPWTVTSGGEGRHYPTEFAAMAEVRRLLAKGITNIDVGCMQINLRYHGTAFEDLAEAFDPLKNTDYAARFLIELKERHGSWRDAIEHYHSGNSVRGKNYRDAVSKLQQKAYKGETVTMADPSTDHLELATAAAQRADALAADALARQERHADEQALREERAERQREIATERALQLRQEFEDRKARRLAEWEKRKAERRARSGMIASAD